MAKKLTPELLDTFKQVKIGHCGGYEIPRAYILDMLASNNKACTAIRNSKAKHFVALQGQTQIMGYLLVLQTLTKRYKDLELIAITDNISVYGV